MVAAVPERTSIRQVYAFVLAAHEASMGKSVSIKDLITLAGEHNGKQLLGQGIERQFDLFRQPSEKVPEALNWIVSEEDTNDRRRKYLSLTDDGIEALTDIILALRGAAGNKT